MQDRKVDLTGALWLTGFALFLALNQVMIKVTNGGFGPIFFAGLRSAGAAVVLGVWIWANPRLTWPSLVHWRSGLLLSIFFFVEFFALFLALDWTTVSRASIMFYTMPMWLAVMSHFYLPSDTLTLRKGAGLICAFGGVVWAIVLRPDSGEANYGGDIAALVGAMGWAAIALTMKISPLRYEPPEHGLLWQLVLSAVFFLIAAPFMGPLIRELEPIHLWGLAFHIFLVASTGFLVWFWLLSKYSASGVASFGFISPVAAVGLGAILLQEEINFWTIGALVLVALGIFLINSTPKRRGAL